MIFSVHTLGCKVNQYESEAISRIFVNHGYTLSSDFKKSDVICINTCAVTEESVRKSCQSIRRAKRQNPNSIVCVCGCTSQTEPNIAERVPEADIIIGNQGKTRLCELVDRFLQTHERIVEIGDISNEHCFEKMTADRGERTRATLKIQDGCNNFCSYCIIPYARGRIRSKDIEESYAEAKMLVEDIGYKEIVLTGIHLDSYGRDGKNYDIINLLEMLDPLDGLKRVRLGSLEPIFFTDENVNRIKNLKKLCHHFHLSLQSGCEKTLKDMNRHYTPDEFEAVVNRLRAAFDDCAITTDIIVGFPGETDEDFEQSMRFAEKIGFSKIHVFPFSERHGTRAAQMTGKLSENIKSERCEKMSKIGQKSESDFYASLVGKTVEVLFETYKNGEARGHTSNYAEIAVKTDKELSNEILSVIITESFGEYAYGKTV